MSHVKNLIVDDEIMQMSESVSQANDGRVSNLAEKPNMNAAAKPRIKFSNKQMSAQHVTAM